MTAVLTNRETEILHRVADGKTNGEIGMDLFLSEDTIKTHVRRIFRKVGARDRAQLVHLAHVTGLLTAGAESSTEAKPVVPIVELDRPATDAALRHSYGDRHQASCDLWRPRVCDCLARMPEALLATTVPEGHTS